MATTEFKRGESTTNFITTLRQEVLKSHSVYDVSDRLIELYEAVVWADQGEECLLTKYEYVGVKTIVENTREFKATWDSSWDITP